MFPHCRKQHLLSWTYEQLTPLSRNRVGLGDSSIHSFSWVLLCGCKVLVILDNSKDEEDLGSALLNYTVFLGRLTGTPRLWHWEDCDAMMGWTQYGLRGLRKSPIGSRTWGKDWAALHGWDWRWQSNRDLAVFLGSWLWKWGVSTMVVEPGEGLSNKWLVPFPFAFLLIFFFFEGLGWIFEELCTVMEFPGISGAFPATISQIKPHSTCWRDVQSGISSHRCQCFTHLFYLHLYFILHTYKYVHMFVFDMVTPSK